MPRRDHTTCSVCDNLLGDELPPGETKHALCAWGKASDWSALAPWFGARLHGVDVSGG